MLTNISSSHTDNWKKDFLISGKESTFGINDSIVAAAKKLLLTIVNQMQNLA